MNQFPAPAPATGSAPVTGRRRRRCRRIARRVAATVASAALAPLAVLTTLAIALPLAAAVEPASAESGPPLTRETRELRPIDAVCVIDDSGSEFGADGTDPFALRYRACMLAASYLSSTATDGLNHRFGVVSFGTGATTRTPELLDLPGDLGAVEQALADPVDLGDTNYAAGMQAATDLLGPPQEGRRQIVLVMGDGIPDVPGRSQDQAFADIRAAVGASSAEVLVFQADPAGRAPDLEARWAEQGVDAVQRIASLSDGSLERAFIDALRRAIGMDRGDEVHLTEDRPSATVDVPNYLEALSITWFAPGEPSIRVTPAGGGKATTLRRSAVGTQSFALPKGGRWRLELTEGSSALVAVDLVPVAAAVRSPGDGAPLGRDLVVEATFETTAGAAIAEVPSDPRYFGAVVTDPKGGTTEVELRRDRRGPFTATRPVPLDRTGTWQVDLVMKSRDGNVVGQAGRTFTVTATPWVSIDQPTVRSRQRIVVPITLRQGAEPVDARKALGEDPQAAVLATLLDADGTAIETVRARWTGGSQFEARFDRSLDDGARTWVRAELDSETAAGAPVSDAIDATITGRPSSGALWSQRLRAVATVLALLVLGSATAYAVWLLRRPRLHGRLDLSSFGGPSAMPVTGGRWRRISGHRHRSVWVWAERNGTVHRSRAPIPWPFRATIVPLATRSTTAPPRPRPRATATT